MRSVPRAGRPPQGSVAALPGAARPPLPRPARARGPARPPAPISERARIARQVDRARDLAERLSQLGPAGPRVAFHLFPGETHQSVVDPAIRLGLDFVLQR